MTDEQGYNGWKNYETWAVALWINNDQGSQEEAFQVIREAMEGSESPSVADRLTIDAADALKEWLEQFYYDACEQIPGMFSDLLGAAWSEVDWYDLAQTFLSDLEEVEA